LNTSIGNWGLAGYGLVKEKGDSEESPLNGAERQHNINRSESRSTEALIKEQNSFVNPFSF
jgi:hypothetical protein